MFGARGWIRTTNSTILKVLRTPKGLEPFVQDASRLFTVSALTHYLVDIVGIEPTHPEGTDLQSAATLLLRRMSIVWWLVEVTLLCLMIISHSFYF